MAVLVAVLVCWGLTLWLVPTEGEFPLNDDWIYARAVQDWMEAGHYTGHPFSTANLVGQAAWGHLFCATLGFSFTALRWSTLVLWLLAAWAVAASALALRARPLAAALAGGLVIANPLAMNLGYTFMTDVPFLAAMALAGFCYLRALAAPRASWLLAGSLLGAWGLLIRQFAVLLPLAALLAFLPLAFRMGRRPALRLLPPFVAPWLAAAIILHFLPSYAGALGHVWDPDVLGYDWPERYFGGLKFYGVALAYLALFALPLAPAPAWHWLRYALGSWRRRAAAVAVVFGALLLIVCVAAPRRIPFLGNLIYDTGVGPMTMKGVFMETHLWRPVSIGGWWWIPTLLGLLGAAWMVAATIRWIVLIPGDGRRPIGDARRRQQVFLMLWAVFMILALYHPWLPIRFDRYLLGALAPVLVLAAMAPGSRGRALMGVQLLAFAAMYGFSVAGLQDYLAWNTARWDTVNRLMDEEGIPPTEIDAGYEFNGWYTSSQFIEKDGPSAFLKHGPLGWWAVGDTWAVSWLPRPGFEKVEEVPYDSWLAGEKGKLLLLKKLPE